MTDTDGGESRTTPDEAEPVPGEAEPTPDEADPDQGAKDPDPDQAATEPDPDQVATEPTPDQAATGDADSVLISYPADLSEWGRFQVEKSEFQAFLRKTLDTVAVGDTWEEFVGVGCCGNTLDVPLRVEAVTGGRRVGPDTEIEYEVPAACGIEGGWQVQSEAGPNEF